MLISSTSCFVTRIVNTVYAKYANLFTIARNTQAQDCPLRYTNPTAPTVHDVLGTWMMSTWAEHQRYAHVAALRSDKESAEVLGGVDHMPAPYFLTLT